MEKKKSLDTQPSQLCRKSEEKEEEGDPIFQTYIFSLIFVIISFPLCKRKFINKENTKILCSDFYSHLRDLRISLQPDLEDRFKNKYAITFVSSGYRDTWIYIYIFFFSARGGETRASRNNDILHYPEACHLAISLAKCRPRSGSGDGLRSGRRTRRNVTSAQLFFP